MIFVSYSHKDAKALKQFQRFLKPLERTGLVDSWDDTRLLGGDTWATEIAQALGDATTAVLFVSQDFLASDFIYRQELPPIVARAEAGKLTLIPVFLSPSSVDELEIPFTDLDSGEEQSVKLTKYQGFGSPSKTLAKLTWSDRERTYEKLTRRLKELEGQPVENRPRRAGVAAGRPAVAEPARAYELTIELVRDGDKLTTRYHLPGREPIASDRVELRLRLRRRLEPIREVIDRGDRATVESLIASAAAGCGQILFRTLFGPMKRWEPVLRQVFARPPEAPRPNPAFAPVRLRICTMEPLLIDLPWRLAAYGGRLAGR